MTIVYFVIVQLGYDNFWELKGFLLWNYHLNIFFLRFAYVFVRQGGNFYYWKCQWSPKKGPKVSSRLLTVFFVLF